MDEMTPYSILDSQLSQLQGYYKDQQNKLAAQRPSQEQWNRTIANLQSDYDTQKFKINALRSQVKDVEDSNINPAMKNEAMWRLVLPPEHAAAMFPKPVKIEPEPRGRFTPGEFKTYKDEFIAKIKTTEHKPSWYSNSVVDPKELKQAYFDSRDAYGYDDQMNSAEQRAFDMAWNAGVKKSGDKFISAWDGLTKNDPDVMVSRTYKNRMLTDTAKKISPLAVSVQNEKRQLGLDEIGKIYAGKPSVENLNEIGGNYGGKPPVENMVAGQTVKPIPEPKTQTEYDAIPSGTQYRDTDGKLKLKK